MAWHVASRSPLSASGLAEPLAAPLDFEYLQNKRGNWWKPEQRLGQLLPPMPSTSSPRQLPPALQCVTPRYAPFSAKPTLREHIFTTRRFAQVNTEQGKMTGTLPGLGMSTPRLAYERGLKIPTTPLYDGSVYDRTWSTVTSVSGYFGPPH